MRDPLGADLDAAMLETLRSSMADRSLSAVALAARSGISRPTLARKLAQGGTFTLQEWDQLARALEDHLDDMLEVARQRLRHLGD